MENSFLDNSWNKKEIKSETGECLRNADNKTLHSRNCGVGLKHAERKFCICVNDKELSTWFKKLENELQRKPKNRVKQTKKKHKYKTNKSVQELRTQWNVPLANLMKNKIKKNTLNGKKNGKIIAKEI